MENGRKNQGKGIASTIPKPKVTVKQMMVKKVVSSINKAKDKKKVNPNNS